MSGRVLYVDANRGRDNAETQNDPSNVIKMPGPDSAALDETGIRIAAQGFADFSSINAAITYASACAARGEAPLEDENPYVIMVAPGYYEEALAIVPHVFLVNAGEAGMTFAADDTTFPAGSVLVRAVTGYHSMIGVPTSPPSSTNPMILRGITLESTVATDSPALLVDGGSAFLLESSVIKNADLGTALTLGDTTDWAFLSAGRSMIQGPDPTVVAPGEEPCGLLLAGGGMCFAVLAETTVTGADAILSPSPSAELTLNYSSAHCGKADNWCYKGIAKSLVMDYCHLGHGTGAGGGSVGVGVGAAAGASTENMEVMVRHSDFSGVYRVLGAATTGTVGVTSGAVTLDDLSDLDLVGGNITHTVLPIIGGSGGSSDVWEPAEVNAGNTPYSMQSGEVIAVCMTTASAVEVVLPDTPTDGRLIVVKDQQGNAAINNITVTCQGTDLFNAALGGLATYIINTNGAAMTFFYYDGVWSAI